MYTYMLFVIFVLFFSNVHMKKMPSSLQSFFLLRWVIGSHLSLDDNAQVVRVHIDVDQRAVQVPRNGHLQHDLSAPLSPLLWHQARLCLFEPKHQFPLVALSDIALGFSLPRTRDGFLL